MRAMDRRGLLPLAKSKRCSQSTVRADFASAGSESHVSSNRVILSCIARARLPLPIGSSTLIWKVLGWFLVLYSLDGMGWGRGATQLAA